MNQQFYVGLIQIICLGIISCYFHSTSLIQLPHSVHAWAQADRMAIAQQYAKHYQQPHLPRSYLLNKQFPDGWETPYDENITAVEFPVHEYIVGLTMHILGSQKPIIFHLYIFLFTLSGIFFLYLTVWHLSHSLWLTLLITNFAFFSPIFFYYQDALLPSIPAIALIWMGLYNYLRHIETKQNQFFFWCIFTWALAGFTRSPFLIFPFFLLAFEGFRKLYWKLSTSRFKVTLFILFFSILFFSRIYDHILRERYGSLFLDHFVPAESFADLKIRALEAIDKWVFSLYSSSQYLILILLIIIAFWKSRSLLKISSFTEKQWFVGGLTISSLIAYFFYFILMVKQFRDHDYYFLDSFYVLVLVLLLFVSTFFFPFSINSRNKAIVIPAIILISFWWMVQAKEFHQLRTDPFYSQQTVHLIENYHDAQSTLQELEKEQEKKLLIFNNFAPNIPFMMLDHQGYAGINAQPFYTNLFTSWDFDLALSQYGYMVSNLLPQNPDLPEKLTFVEAAGDILFYEKNRSEITQSVSTFLDLKKELFSTNIEEKNKQWWSVPESFPADSNNVYSLDSTQIYGATLSIQPDTFLTTGFVITSSINMRSIQGALPLIVIEINDRHGSSLYYEARSFLSASVPNQEWMFKQAFFKPVVQLENVGELKVYLWNQVKGISQYRNFKVSFYSR